MPNERGQGAKTDYLLFKNSFCRLHDYIFRKCTSSFQDLELLEEEALRDVPWDSAASKFHPHPRRPGDPEWEDVASATPTGAWGCLLDDHTKQLRDPSEERAPLSAALITCLGISENPQEALYMYASTFRANLEF